MLANKTLRFAGELDLRHTARDRHRPERTSETISSPLSSKPSFSHPFIGRVVLNDARMCVKNVHGRFCSVPSTCVRPSVLAFRAPGKPMLGIEVGQARWPRHRRPCNADTMPTCLTDRPKTPQY